MSEQPADLQALDHEGHPVYGEVNIDHLTHMPQEMTLSPHVSATREALEAIDQADLILIRPGSFLTSLMPLLLLGDLTKALKRSSAHMIYIGNLGRELSVATASLILQEKLAMMENKIGRRIIDAVVVSPTTDTGGIKNRIIIQQPIAAADIPYRHDRELLRQALENTMQQLS